MYKQQVAGQESLAGNLLYTSRTGPSLHRQDCNFYTHLREVLEI